MTTVSVNPDERTVLLNWKKRSDTMILPRLKAEAVLYSSMGVAVEIIAPSVRAADKVVSADQEAFPVLQLLFLAP